MERCMLGTKSQEWILDDMPPLSRTLLRNAMAPNKCIDAADMQSGTHLMLWDCNGFSQQRWTITPKADPAHAAVTYGVYLPDSGVKVKCLATDVPHLTAVV